MDHAGPSEWFAEVVPKTHANADHVLCKTQPNLTFLIEHAMHESCDPSQTMPHIG